MLRPSAASCTWPAYFSVASWYAFGQPTGRGSAICMVTPRRRIHSIDGETRLPRRGMSPLVSTSPGRTSAARGGTAESNPTRAVHAIAALRGRMVPLLLAGGGRTRPPGRRSADYLPALLAGGARRRKGGAAPPAAGGQSASRRSRSALPITDTELRLMAALGVLGVRGGPPAG